MTGIIFAILMVNPGDRVYLRDTESDCQFSKIYSSLLHCNHSSPIWMDRTCAETLLIVNRLIFTSKKFEFFKNQYFDIKNSKTLLLPICSTFNAVPLPFWTSAFSAGI